MVKASACFVLELVLFRSEKIFKAHHKTRSWCLSGVIFKIFDDHLRRFYVGAPPLLTGQRSVTWVTHLAVYLVETSGPSEMKLLKRRRNFYPGLNERKKFATGLSPCVPPCLFCSTMFWRRTEVLENLSRDVFEPRTSTGSLCSCF